MTKKTKRGQTWKIFFVLMAAATWASVPLFTHVASASSDDVPVIVRTATLTAPGGAVNPHGTAEFDVYASGARELEVEIEDVNMADGTSLTAFVNGSSIGQIVLSLQKGKIKLRSESGQTVPNVENGATVQVKNGATVLVSGVFGGSSTPNPTPTASPSASPSGSPTGSPSATPTGTPTSSPTPTASPSPNGESELFAILTGPTMNGVLPGGFAEFEVHSSRLELEITVRQINLPAGTSLNVSVGGVSVGQLILQTGGEGRLRLRTDRGETVPNVVVGTPIVIKNGATTILSGMFGNAANPSPSPTPTGSPSPGGTPSPSPTPLGKRFEVHLSGAALNPPVTTNGRGEIVVTLNADQTQAQVTGEYNLLSSAQTSARITVTIGSTTTTVIDLGVLGGTEGHFPIRSFAVTAAQVAQLRAGLWFATVGTVNNPAGEIGGALRNDDRGGDFDGDGHDDFAVFRPTTGEWYSLNNTGYTVQLLGGANDKIVSSDYDGDGRTDTAVYRDVNGFGVWTIVRSSDGGTTQQQFGLASDIPTRGDFDGDGRSDLAVFRPDTGVWYVQKSNLTGYIIVKFGQAGDKPLAADMDGDGKDDIVIFRPSEGNWYWIRSSDGGIGIVHFGQNGDIPAPADFDGDGADDITVFRPSTGVWYFVRSADISVGIIKWGQAGDVPVPGNFDADNRADISIFRPSTGEWYVLRSTDGGFSILRFGQNGDVPVAAK